MWTPGHTEAMNYLQERSVRGIRKVRWRHNKRTLIDRYEVRRRQGWVLPRQGHIWLLFPFLPVDLDGVYWRGYLGWVDGGTEAFVRRSSAVRRLRDMRASTVGIHEA